MGHHLGVPVLLHKSLKPSYFCISAIRVYFSSLETPLRDDELFIVGDRIFTDVVLANRMKRSRIWPLRAGSEVSQAHRQSIGSGYVPRGPLSIWTTGLWKKESMGMRWMERKVVDLVERWFPRQGSPLDIAAFVTKVEDPPTKQAAPSGILARIWRSLRRK